MSMSIRERVHYKRYFISARFTSNNPNSGCANKKGKASNKWYYLYASMATSRSSF